MPDSKPATTVAKTIKNPEKVATKPKGFQKFARGTKTFEHDLFRLEIAQCLKNEHWIKGDPWIVKKKHKHFFHSVNDTTGSPRVRCSMAAGHFHVIKVKWEEGKAPVTTCGPPQRVKKRKLPGADQYVAANEGISWPKIEKVLVDGGVTVQEKLIVDDHRHEMTYIGTEILDSNSRASLRKATREDVQAMVNKAGMDHLSNQAVKLSALSQANPPGVKEG